MNFGRPHGGPRTGPSRPVAGHQCHRAGPVRGRLVLVQGRLFRKGGRPVGYQNQTLEQIECFGELLNVTDTPSIYTFKNYTGQYQGLGCTDCLARSALIITVGLLLALTRSDSLALRARLNSRQV